MIAFGLNCPRRVRVLLGLLLTAMILTACGSGADTSSSNLTGTNRPASGSTDRSGDLVVSLTDAEGDFAAYRVEVTSLTLTKANGAEVAVLPLSVPVDFAQYTDMTEFLTAAGVPAGVYVAATMTLDYGDADIWVENADGNPVQVDNIVDDSGAPLTRTDVTVQLENRSRIVIAPGIPMHLQLDFDLSATNTVSFDEQGRATLSVDPYLIADVNRVDAKTHRLRGLLDEVDAAAGTFLVAIRPSYAALDGNHIYYGRMAVTTDAETLYDIDGSAYQGQAGLEAMQQLIALSAVVVEGELAFDPLRFEADQVHAGTSVPWGDKDIVSGSVVARQNNTLTVKGASLLQSDGSMIFNDLVTVGVGEATRVTRQFSAQNLGIDDISVGQQVCVFGTLTSDDPTNLILDATAGQVRLMLTTVRGTVTGVDTADTVAQLKLDLQSINNHRAAGFDFSGTGSDAGSHADADAYEINTAALDLAGLTAGDPVKVRGFVQPFGAAPQDFNARTIIDTADVKAFLKVRWQPASAEAVDTISLDGLTLNLAGATGAHHVFRSWLFTDLTTLGSSPAIAPAGDGSGMFIVNIGGVVQVFATYAAFIDDLQNHLTAGWQVRKIWARGDFDDASATLTAGLVEIHID